LHHKANPQALGVFIDAGKDQLVVRVDDPTITESSESWWMFALNDGTALGRLQPRAL